MFKFNCISESLTKSIKYNNIISDEVKLEQVEYGIYMLLSEVVKLAVILIISALLNMFVYSVVAIVIFGIHRGFIGGVHAKTHWGCFLSYCAIIFGTLFISLYLNVTMLILFFTLYPVCMFIVYKYAPADIANKPVVSKMQKRYLRTGGFIFLTLVFISSLFVPQPYGNILVFISLAECITMLPIVYSITGNKYGNEEVE